MKTKDFVDWQSGVSQHLFSKQGNERPYLNNMCWTRFSKDGEEAKMSYKNKKKFTQVKERRIQPRGISKKKKEAIVRQLVPLMPLNRRRFWIELPESQKSKDLTQDVGNAF